MPKGTKVILTSHELRLSARPLGQRANDAVEMTQRLRAESKRVREVVHGTRDHSERLKTAVEAQIFVAELHQRELVKKSFKEIKESPLHVLPCESACVQERCEHYDDCQSFVEMHRFLMQDNPDPAVIARLYHDRNRAIDSWRKKGFFRSCLFKVPHNTLDEAKKHVHLLTLAEPDSNFYFYPCRYAPADEPHYHVAHSLASFGSLLRANQK